LQITLRIKSNFLHINKTLINIREKVHWDPLTVIPMQIFFCRVHFVKNAKLATSRGSSADVRRPLQNDKVHFGYNYNSCDFAQIKYNIFVKGNRHVATYLAVRSLYRARTRVKNAKLAISHRWY